MEAVANDTRFLLFKSLSGSQSVRCDSWISTQLLRLFFVQSFQVSSYMAADIRMGTSYEQRRSSAHGATFKGVFPHEDLEAILQ